MLLLYDWRDDEWNHKKCKGLALMNAFVYLHEKKHCGDRGKNAGHTKKVVTILMFFLHTFVHASLSECKYLCDLDFWALTVSLFSKVNVQTRTIFRILVTSCWLLQLLNGLLLHQCCCVSDYQRLFLEQTLAKASSEGYKTRRAREM